jgi:DNA-binding NtrC family response regulator
MGQGSPTNTDTSDIIFALGYKPILRASENLSDSNIVTVEVSSIGFNNLVREFEKTLIEKVLLMFDGNHKKTREYLNISERTMSRYISIHGIKNNVK